MFPLRIRVIFYSKILETVTKNPQKNLIREGVFLNVIQNE